MVQKIVISGQGYVGLPVAMRAVEKGHSVVGVDVDSRRIDALAGGESFVEDITDDKVRSALASGRYLPTTDYDATDGFDVAVITVPTPLRESLPDLAFVEQAARSLAPRISVGATVILESTTYPGTTVDLLVPLLEAESGLTAGADFYVGYSPERIDPGNPTWGFVETPKVVSGIDEASLSAVEAFYADLVDTTVPVSGTKEAELTKLLENTFRHVNIALVNELAIFADQLGVDIWETIDAASTKPFGYMRFTPGPGVGGHCLPVDPSYLSFEVRRKLGRAFRFVELANDVNEHMPDHVVERVTSMLNDLSLPVRGSTILLVGLAYKRDSGDTREAPGLRVLELLRGLGARVQAADSRVEAHRWPEGAERVDLTPAVVAGADLAIVVTDHSDLDLSLLVDVPTFDTRNAVALPGAVRL